MPRPSPLTLIDIPQVEPKQPLSQMHDFASLLGLSKLPDEVARELAHCIAQARETPALVAGLTRQRQAAELKRIAKKLRRERPGHPEIKVRQLLADPRFGFDTEIFSRLAPLASAPTAVLLAEVEACRREIAGLPRLSPQRGAGTSAGGTAVWFFLTYAAAEAVSDPNAWWQFVLAFLDTASFPTEKLYQHPEDLRPLLDAMRVQLLGSELLQRARAGER
jgi:hypothetical protein